MRIVVVGAFGRTGLQVVKLGVERGHEMAAFARRPPPEDLDPKVEVVRGDAGDAAGVGEAVRGTDAVISAMGPVAGVTVTEVSEATATVVGAMEQNGPMRLVAPTNTRVLDDTEVKGEFANVAAEHRRTAAILRGSHLDWTIIAAPLLTDEAATSIGGLRSAADAASLLEPPEPPYEAVVDGAPPGESISRGDFALALLDALNNDDWIGHVVGVTD